MVAGGDPDCGHHLLCRHHVLPVGELPAAVWGHPVHRLPAGRRMADPVLGLLLVVALPHQLRISLHHDTWHQVIIRDTSFTPSHVVVFYGSFPMYIVCGVASYLYAMTRLPLYSRGTSFPLVMAIAGPLMILPNVGLNEWGHAFWFMEELFSAPLHWGFVILGWSGLFSGGIAAQIITRYSNLTDVVWNNQSKVILNNRIVP